MPAPTKIQWVGYPNTATNGPAVWHVRLPNASASGDTIIVTGQFGSGSDIITAIADDQGGSLSGGEWVKDKIQANAGNGQSVCILRRSNVPANTREVTITLSGATSFTQFCGILVNNLATSSVVDGTPSGGNPTGTSLAAGNITTSTTNTFVVTVCAETQGTSITAPTRFTAPNNYTIWAPDPIIEFCCMYGTQAAAGTFNPALTSGRSFSASACAAVAYKTATSGGAASSTVEVVAVQCCNFNGGSASKNGGMPTTLTIDLPCQSGVTAVAFAYDDGVNIFTGNPAGNTSSSPANTWNATTFSQAPSGPACGFVYATRGSFSATGSLTLSVTGGPAATIRPFELYIWHLTNADLLDASGSGTGTLNTTPPVTETTVLDSAITTASANEVLLFFNQEDSQTVTSVTSSNGSFLFMAPDLGVYESLDAVHDAGFGHVYAPSIASFNFDVTWTEREGNSDPVGPWCAQAVAFRSKPPPARPMFRGH